MKKPTRATSVGQHSNRPPRTSRNAKRKSTLKWKAAQVDLPTLEELEQPNGPASILERVRFALKTLGSGHRLWVRGELAKVYAVAQFLQVNEGAWMAYCSHSQWDQFGGGRPRYENQENALKYAVRSAVGFDGDADSKAAHLYFSALQSFYLEKVPASEIPMRLNDIGGIEKAKKANVKRKKLLRGEPVGETPTVPGTGDDSPSDRPDVSPASEPKPDLLRHSSQYVLALDGSLWADKFILDLKKDEMIQLRIKIRGRSGTDISGEITRIGVADPRKKVPLIRLP